MIIQQVEVFAQEPLPQGFQEDFQEQRARERHIRQGESVGCGVPGDEYALAS